MVNQIQGEKSLEQILDIINNKEVYAKYLKEIKSVRNDIDYKLSLIEKSCQIETLYDKAKKNEKHDNERIKNIPRGMRIGRRNGTAIVGIADRPFSGPC